MEEPKIPAHIHSLIYEIVQEALYIGPSMIPRKDLIEILDWCVDMERDK